MALDLIWELDLLASLEECELKPKHPGHPNAEFGENDQLSNFPVQCP